VPFRNGFEIRSSPIVVMSQELGKGAYFLTGGTHHSMAIDMKDGIVIVDLPNNQARAAAVIASIRLCWR